MTLAQHLHESIYRLPRGYVQTALLAAVRPDWSEEGNRMYIAAMSREELEQAFVILCDTVARYEG